MWGREAVWYVNMNWRPRRMLGIPEKSLHEVLRQVVLAPGAPYYGGRNKYSIVVFPHNHFTILL